MQRDEKSSQGSTSTLPGRLRQHRGVTSSGGGNHRGSVFRQHVGRCLAVRHPELHRRYLERGIELTASATPDQFSAYVKAEFEKKAKLARDAGIRME